MSDVTVVYLARKANGPEPIGRFAEAYLTHGAGLDHDLLFACKGYDDADARSVIPMMPARWSMREYPDTGYDIGTYRRAAEDVTTEYVCFLNSFSRPLVDGWLARMMAVLEPVNVGLTGATVSNEGIPGCPFPNYHVRTNAFCMRRDLFLELAPKDPTREECLQFEAGPNSLTRQVQARRLEALGASGMVFRMNDQQGLLVADNRTDAYQNADRHTRDYLHGLAWGFDA